MPYPLLPRVPHGGPQAPDDTVLDFSVNANPLGPNPALVAAWQAADLTRYPDPTYRRAREALGALHGYPPDGVVLAVGASELLHRLVRAVVGQGDLVIALGAPFGQLERAVALQQANLRVVPRDLSALPDGARLVYLSNPHNPTGHFLDLRRLAPAPVIIVDEAYLPFMASGRSPAPQPNVVRLQSPGKAHGLLGMRLAYALADPAVAAQLENLQPAWAFPAAHAAALAALPQQQGFLDATLPTIRAWAHDLARAFGATPTGIHFFTVSVPDASRVAATLLERGLRVRDCASFGRPDLIRVATRRPDDNRRLVQAWKELYE
jgi:histidinol-phosphate aminotransferase